jgi:hypothetical protein
MPSRKVTPAAFTKMEAKVESLEGEELTWEALMERYGEGGVYEELTDLKQDGTVDEYITEFEYLIAQIPKLPEKQFRGYFLHGLKAEIRGKVREELGSRGGDEQDQTSPRYCEKEVNGS